MLRPLRTPTSPICSANDPFPPFLAPYYAMKNTAERQGFRFRRTRIEVKNDPLHIPIKVLIVEDSEDKATLEVLELYRGGFYPFFELVNTPKAIEAALRNYKWDLVISGDYLKQIGAFEALSLLTLSGQNVPFVVIAESLGEGPAEALIRSGAQVLRAGALDLLSSVVQREFLRLGEGSFQKLLKLLRHIKEP
jgi:CheY-like chemotaxis protein